MTEVALILVFFSSSFRRWGLPLISLAIFSALGSRGNQTLDNDGTMTSCAVTEVLHSVHYCSSGIHFLLYDCTKRCNTVNVLTLSQHTRSPSRL